MSITLIGFWEACGSGDSHRCSRTVNTGNIIVGGQESIEREFKLDRLCMASPVLN